MKDLMFLEVALLENRPDDISAYFAEVDRHTANEKMRQVGEHYGFKTMDIYGMCVALLRDTSRILGYSDPSGLAKLLGTYQIMTLKIGSVGDEVQQKVREFFGLSPKDAHTIFVTWDGFLSAGMFGQNDEAKKVKVYLLKMEPFGRIAMSADPKFVIAAKDHELKRLGMSLKYICRIANLPEGEFRNAALDDYEALTGRKLTKSAQPKLPYDKDGKAA